MALDVLNAVSNAELHPSSWSLSRALRRVPTPDGGERLQVRMGSEAELVPFALRQARWMFGQLLASIHAVATLPTEPLLDAGDSGQALIDAADVESQ